MRLRKKFWIVFLSFLPFGAAGGVMSWLIGGAVSIAGFSIYRSSTPVNMQDAMQFFSTCWTCQMFADIMHVMSDMLPKVFHEIGVVVLPICVILTALWFVWKLVSGYLNAKVEDPWNITGAFGVHFIKLSLVCALLVAPLPRMMSQIVIEPIFTVGLSLNRVVSGADEFDRCIIATAIEDDLPLSRNTAQAGAYPAKLRYSLACQLAAVHRMTGLGMTAGWTMMNMAFDSEYMHKIMWDIPIFPHIPILFIGFMIIVLFFIALLPIPLYFLEIFIKLSMDLIMLPLMLMSWLFSGWSIMPMQGGRNIRGIINDVVSGTLGIAVTGILITFSLMFIDSAFGTWNGASALQTAIEKNDSKILMDGLMMNNDSLITVILMGLFLAMMMTSIPALAKTFFSVNISRDFYNTAKNNFLTLAKKLNIPLPKWLKAGASGIANAIGGITGGGGGGGAGGGNVPVGYMPLSWLASDGRAFIDTGFVPDDTAGITIAFRPESGGDRVLAGVLKSVTSSNSQFLVGLDSNIYFGWNSREYANPPATIGGNYIEVKMNWQNERKFRVNGRIAGDISAPLVSGNVWSLYIFGYNDSNRLATGMAGTDKIKCVQLSSGGTVVHEFIPARRNSDKVLGMYDTKTGRFFTNAGSGNFTGG